MCKINKNSLTVLSLISSSILLPTSTKADLFKCVACTNKPANSSYISAGDGTSNCSWSCNTGYTAVKANNIGQTFCCSNSLIGPNVVWDESAGPCATKNICSTPKPANSSYTSSCDFTCNSGYIKEGNNCIVNPYSSCVKTNNSIKVTKYNCETRGCSTGESRYFSSGTAFTPGFGSCNNSWCRYDIYLISSNERLGSISTKTECSTRPCKVVVPTTRYIVCNKKLSEYKY